MADLLGVAAQSMLFRMDGESFAIGWAWILGKNIVMRVGFLRRGELAMKRRHLPTLKMPKDDMTKAWLPVNMHAVPCFACSRGQLVSQ